MRISNYKPNGSNDSRYFDRIIYEQFQVGGTDLFIHKYIGTKNPSNANATAVLPQYSTDDPTHIQDLLLMENRDRKYEKDIYQIRGVFNVQDLDFNLSQFGMYFDNDTLFITVHITNTVETLGRKPLSGDVIEIPSLRDQYALNDSPYALPRFFVVNDVGRATEGYAVSWTSHLYRIKCSKISNEAQYSDIFNQPVDPDVNFKGDYDPTVTYNPGDVVRYLGGLYTVTQASTGNLPTDPLFFSTYSGETLSQLLSVSDKSKQINDAIIAQAEADAAMSGYETRQFFTLSTTNGDARLETADITDIDASYTGWDASEILERPLRSGYTGYLLGDGIPENGVPFGHGINFPNAPSRGDFFLRTDFLPNRLFKYDGKVWIKHEDAVRHTLTNTDTRQTLKTTFINNTDTTTLQDGTIISQRQAVSKALKPRADF